MRGVRRGLPQAAGCADIAHQHDAVAVVGHDRRCAGCEPGATTPGTPVGANGGPYAHNIAVGTTADGMTVTGLAEVLAHASVPDGVRLPDGSIGVYYVNGETDGVWLARLTGRR